MTEIQRIVIKKIYVPKIRSWEIQPPTLDIIYKPVVDIPACVDAHRNNLVNLINEDELGTYQACGTFSIPSFEPLEYNPANFIYTAPAKQQEKKQEEPLPQQQKTKVTQLKKKEEIEIEPCPPKKPQFRQGDYRNDKRIERLVSWERSIDGSCDPIWQKVPFRESFIGTPQMLISTSLLGVVAGGSAILAPLIQKLISQIFKKIKKRLASKKDKEE